MLLRTKFLSTYTVIDVEDDRVFLIDLRRTDAGEHVGA